MSVGSAPMPPLDWTTWNERFARRLPAMLEDLSWLVGRESPSLDKPRLDAVARDLADRCRRLGARVELVANPRGGDHLKAVFFENLAGRSNTPPSPILVLGHFDTVWPVGILERMPIRLDQKADTFAGPGALDMKAGIVIVLHALEELGRFGLAPSRPVTLLLTSDEEIGSPTSRNLIETEARRSAYALVVEPSLANGGLKTARKGVGRFRLDVQGKAAHAGIAPEKGVSATLELAHQLVRIGQLGDPEAGTTLNIGRIQGGGATNVVAETAWAELDVRVVTLAEQARIERELNGLRAVLNGARLTLSGGFNRPPMERTAAIGGLFQHARDLAARLGFELVEGATGGGSDANFTAALGVPTLDGLGARGDGAHASHEHIRISSLPERAALLAALIVTDPPSLGPLA